MLKTWLLADGFSEKWLDHDSPNFIRCWIYWWGYFIALLRNDRIRRCSLVELWGQNLWDCIWFWTFSSLILLTHSLIPGYYKVTRFSVSLWHIPLHSSVTFSSMKGCSMICSSMFHSDMFLCDTLFCDMLLYVLLWHVPLWRFCLPVGLRAVAATYKVGNLSNHKSNAYFLT